MSDTVSIKKILGNLLSHPMIVETGEYGIWKWHRWNNGIIECWGRTPVKTYTFTSQSGNGYYTSDEFTLPPGLFSTVDYFFSERAQGTGSTPNYTLISVDGRILDTTKAGVWIHSPTSGSQSLSISLCVRGTWDNSALIDPEQVKPFYFQVADNTQTARVGFKSAEFSIIADTINPPTIDYNSFPNYKKPTLQYSYDNSTWYSYTFGSLITIGGNNSDIVYFRGNNLEPWYDTYQITTTEVVNEETKTYDNTFRAWTQAVIEDSNVKSGGNIMSLRYTNFRYSNALPCDNTFKGLFYKCQNLIQAPILPATVLTDSCYSIMFYDTRITVAPILRATTMKPHCYASMLCHTDITNAPELPATTLADACYGYEGLPDEAYGNTLIGMFGECHSLINAPVLPATTLAPNCYQNMFYGCRNLISSPALPATILTDYCYNGMFTYCTSLINPPTLSATTLALSCYSYMFSYCTSLVNPPALPATTLAQTCYMYMFNHCHSLTKTPTLSATTMVYGCYQSMFNYCTSLVNPPVLPATILATYCYSGMFSNCTSLITTPKLPVTTIETYCYGGWIGEGMFQGCTGLQSITTLPATSFGDKYGCYAFMFRGAIKASTTNTAPCIYAYRVPTSGTASGDYIASTPKLGSSVTQEMFSDINDMNTGFTPTVNTTIYINVPSFS